MAKRKPAGGWALRKRRLRKKARTAAFRSIDQLGRLFEKRVGLVELLLGRMRLGTGDSHPLNCR